MSKTESQLQGKTALVTGASSGIGKALALTLAARGARVVITARSQAALEEVAAAVNRSYGTRVEVIAQDLSAPNGPANLLAELVRRDIRVDILANNAGFGKWGDFLASDAATYNEMIRLNVNAVMELSHGCLPSMLAKGEGAILNVASGAAFVPMPYAAVYAASKAFVLSFSEALYGEYASRGIKVTALCPGATTSKFSQVATAPQGRDDERKNPPSSGVKEDSPEFVAETGVDALFEGKLFVISGARNYVTPWIARFLPRKTVVRMVGTMWKQFLDS